MPSNQPDSNLTNPDPADAVALPTWEEAELALMEERGTALHRLIHQEEPNQRPYDAEWRALLSDVLAETRKAERDRDRWMPIDEDTPRDGTSILLYAPVQSYQGMPTEERVTVGHWTSDEECQRQIGDCGGECRCPEYEYDDPSWMSWDGGFTAEHPPTHWKHLPEPPRSPDQPAEELK